jgi:N-acetylneuraminic acid mutarotase
MAPGKDADGAVCAEAANDDANTKAGNPAQGNLLAKAMRQSARRLAAGRGLIPLFIGWRLPFPSYSVTVSALRHGRSYSFRPPAFRRYNSGQPETDGDFALRIDGNRLLSKPLMGCVLSVFGASLCAAAQTSGANEWTWMGGSSTVPSDGIDLGVYGALGVPSAANIPASRVFGATWTDNRGHLWLFGGFLYIKDPTWLNDLWEFNPATNEWAWMGGGNTSAPCIDAYGATYCGRRGVYGELGKAAAGNIPGGRDSAMTWTDKEGNLWLFGGDGFDGKGQEGVLNDLWKFNPATGKWAWMGGDRIIPGDDYGPGGVYGTKGEPAPGNNPGALFMAAVWTGKNGDTWLFGGWGYDGDDTNGLPINLWEFYPSTNEWAWMAGSETYDTPWIHRTVFGKKGTPGAANTPGSRWNGASWTDSSGNFWLFGGQGYDAEENSGYLNELWMFNPAIREWTYMAGTETMGCLPNSDKQNCGRAGVYGTMGVPASGNLPGGRTQAMNWTDRDGRFWLFGGSGYNADGAYNILNDLWEFNPTTREWTWIGGNEGAGSGAGVYGTLRVPSPENIPGSRDGAATWTDKSGNFWLFGGNALDANGQIGLPNDFWKFEPAASQ